MTAEPNPRPDRRRPRRLSLFSGRPKGMWQRTYDRLRDEIIAAQMRVDEAFVLGVERLLARLDRPKRRKGFCR